MREKKDRAPNYVERPKYNSVQVKCPYCDIAGVKKIKYSLTGIVPNLITCGGCNYNYVVIQNTEIKLTIIELQDKIEEAIPSLAAKEKAGAEAAR